MGTVDPLMIEWPPLLQSERLLLRAPQAGDGVALNQAMAESLAELRPWLPWAQKMPTRAESELTCRQMAARFAQRSDLPLFIFARAADGGCGRLLGGTGLHRMDWSVPRFEIRMSSDNHKSRAVAERCGFTLEGVLRQDSLDVHGRPRDTAVYARVRGAEEPLQPTARTRTVATRPVAAVKAAASSAAKKRPPRR